VAIGSKFLEIRATNKCTLKKIITVIDANNPPRNPDLPLIIISTIKATMAVN
jgi:hypothetical protein